MTATVTVTDAAETAQVQPNATATGEPLAPTAVPQPEELVVASDIANFTLQDLTVPVGATVKWFNQDSARHTSTAGAPNDLTGVWDSSALATGDSYSFTFGDAGTFPYFCTIHPSMTATVTVTDAAETAQVQPNATATGEPSSPVAEPENLVVASDIANFTLENLNVSVGTTITWTNRDSPPHTTTAGAPNDPTGVWDSSVLVTGDSYSYSFDDAGTFPYFCTIHPSMTATITVAEPSSAQVQPTPNPTGRYADSGY